MKNKIVRGILIASLAGSVFAAGMPTVALAGVRDRSIRSVYAQEMSRKANVSTQEETADTDNTDVNSQPQMVLKQDAVVHYRSSMSTDEIRNNIVKAVFEQISDIPDDVVDQNTLQVEYNASNDDSITWKSLDYKLGSFWDMLYYHPFGHDTEMIRITWPGTEQYPSVNATASITLADLRMETTVEIPDGLELQFQDKNAMDTAVKTFVENNAVVKDTNGNPVAATADDFNIRYTRAAGEQELTVTYKENDNYKSSSTKTTIYITKGDAQIKVASQNITYGTDLPFDKIFSVNPSDAGLVGILAGIDGNGKGRISIAASKDDSTCTMALQLIASMFGDDLTLQELSVKLKDEDTVESLKMILSMSDMSQEDAVAMISSLQQALDVMQEKIPYTGTIRIAFGNLPEDAGVYIALGVTTSANYNTSYDIGTVTIAPARANVKLVFSENLPTSKSLSVDQASNFAFGGEIEGVGTSANIRTYYTGVTSSGKVVASKTPVLEPGSYVETVSVIGGNYQAAPIKRGYKITENQIANRFEQKSVTASNDGQQISRQKGLCRWDSSIWKSKRKISFLDLRKF